MWQRRWGKIANKGGGVWGKRKEAPPKKGKENRREAGEGG